MHALVHRVRLGIPCDAFAPRPISIAIAACTGICACISVSARLGVPWRNMRAQAADAGQAVSRGLRSGTYPRDAIQNSRRATTSVRAHPAPAETHRLNGHRTSAHWPQDHTRAARAGDRRLRQQAWAHARERQLKHMRTTGATRCSGMWVGGRTSGQVGGPRARVSWHAASVSERCARRPTEPTRHVPLLQRRPRWYRWTGEAAHRPPLYTDRGAATDPPESNASTDAMRAHERGGG